MSQPLSWWKDYYASVIWQGNVTDLEEIKGMLNHLIHEAQSSFYVREAIARELENAVIEKAGNSAHTMDQAVKIARGN